MPASYTIDSGFEISDGNHSKPAGSHACRRWRCVACVVVALVLIAVMLILMAMFGPGSKDLKYHDPEVCKGEQLKGVFHGSAHVWAYQLYPFKNHTHMYFSILQ